MQFSHLLMPTEEEYIMYRVMIIQKQSKYIERSGNTSLLSREEVACSVAMISAVFMRAVYCLNLIWDSIFPEDIS
ncbi:hypothetical protein CRU79_24620 [Escherichia sp. E4385]|nr:hypothetical protein CRU79_24620 [Escherichia sp. E4385]